MVYKECPPGSARNPATNRCKKIKETMPTKKEGPPGSARNPVKETIPAKRKNEPKECPPGSVRNPVTNR